MDQLLRVVLLGSAAAGLAILVRTLPWPQKWKQRKPLACISCMSGHASWIVCLVAGLLGEARVPSVSVLIIEWLATTGICACLCSQIGIFSASGVLAEIESMPSYDEDKSR
jgi:hypothetical protein